MLNAILSAVKVSDYFWILYGLFFWVDCVCLFMPQVSRNRDSLRAQLTQLSQYKGVLKETHGIMASQVRATITIIPYSTPLKSCHHPSL